MTVGGKAQSVPLRILIDPRVAADGVTLSDLRSQEALLLKIQALRTSARETSETIKSRRQ